MNPAKSTVLVVGATGSIGRLVVAEALRQGHAVRALVRDPARARGLPAEAERVTGDLTQPQTLTAAVDGIDAVVFTHGSDGGGKGAAEQIDYGGVRNVLLALDGRQVRIALMTAIGVTDREGAYNRATQAHDWKRRGERLVRASGLPYTIVRPGFEALFAACDADAEGAPDAVRDTANMPLADEPARVRDDLALVTPAVDARSLPLPIAATHP